MTETQPSSKDWFRSPRRYFLDAPKEQPGTCFVKNDDYVEAMAEIERLQRELDRTKQWYLDMTAQRDKYARLSPEPRAIAETSVGYRYIPANIATAVCDAAYKRASHTNKKAADALRPAMLAIIEAGIQVPGVRATQPPAPCAKPDAWLVVEPDGWRYLSAGEGDAMAHVAERGNGGTVYPLYRLAQPPSTDAHRENEWADMAGNGIQWLRNIRDGISTPAEALAEMESNLRRIMNLPRASQPPKSDEAEIPLDAKVRHYLTHKAGTVVAIDTWYEIQGDNGQHWFACHRELERHTPTKKPEHPGTWMPTCPICKKSDCRLTYEECHRATAGERDEQ